MAQVYVIIAIILCCLLAAFLMYIVWINLSERARIYREFESEVKFCQRHSSTVDEFIDMVETIKNRYRECVSEEDMTRVIASVYKTLV